MPEKLVNEFRKKISLKEFEVTNTSSSGGSYSKGFQIKEAEKSLQVNIILPPVPWFCYYCNRATSSCIHRELISQIVF